MLHLAKQAEACNFFPLLTLRSAKIRGSTQNVDLGAIWLVSHSVTFSLDNSSAVTTTHIGTCGANDSIV
jgi:hypothetical protein